MNYHELLMNYHKLRVNFDTADIWFGPQISLFVFEILANTNKHLGCQRK